jgi:paraquat-inducible protein A
MIRAHDGPLPMTRTPPRQPPTAHSPMHGARGADLLVAPVLLASLGLLAAGLALPILTVRSFYVFSDEITVLGAVRQLFVDGDVVIGLVIAVFSVAFPLTKIGAALLAWLRPTRRPARVLGWLDVIGKWSMLDVFVVALIIFSAKASGVAEAQTEPGLYLFAAAVLLPMAAIRRIRRRLRDLATGVSV